MVDPQELSALSLLLDEALDLPDDGARARWLVALGPEHAPFRVKLEQLLALHSTPIPALDDGPAIGGLMRTPLAPNALRAGRLIGPYVLIRELGLGGMSSVWLARDDRAPDDAVVALKLPAVSLDSDAFLARFGREREFLRQLEHPGIARMVDAGVSESGQHYLALQYVEGLSLDAYCDAHRLDVRSRIALFIQVLAAVQHAHSRSVLHRDLKPSNILVTDRAEVRLLDFGIAKTLVDGQADETELTAQWGRALTRDFASPEQLVGGTVTVRSDIYSLGVILFELLCGQRPPRPPPPALDATTTPPAVFPPLPSEHCRADSVVAQSEGGATQLARLLAGDIDAIVVRALHQEASERYADVALMSADLSRVLAREPIGTRLQRWRFRVGLLLRRQRGTVSGASVLLLAIGVLGHSSRFAADIETQFAPAVPEAAQAVVISIGPEDYQHLFGGASPLDPLVLGQLLSRTLEGKPAVVGVDIDTSAPTFATLRRAFDAEAMNRIVWGRDIAASDRAGSPPTPRPVLGGAEGAVPVRSGLAVSIVDGSAGIVRWFRRTIPTASGNRPTLGAELAGSVRRADGDDDMATAVRNVRVLPSRRIELPASVVLANGFEWRDRIRGRVVLVGGRYDRADVHPTALGLMHGVEIQANVVETQLTDADYPRPGWWAILIIGLVDLAATIAFFERLAVPRATLASLAFGGALAWVLAASHVFPAWSYALLAALAVVLNQLVMKLWLRLQEPRARLFARVRRHFRDQAHRTR